MTPGPCSPSPESNYGDNLGCCPRLFKLRLRPKPEITQETGRLHSPWLWLGSPVSTEGAVHPSPEAAAARPAPPQESAAGILSWQRLPRTLAPQEIRQRRPQTRTENCRKRGGEAVGNGGKVSQTVGKCGARFGIG